MENAFTSENASFKVWSTLLLLGYIAWLVFLTIRSWSQQKGDRTDFFLAGKSVRLIPSLFTFWATYFSAGAVIGAAGYFYIHGIGNLIFSCCAYIIIGILGPPITFTIHGIGNLISDFLLRLHHKREPQARDSGRKHANILIFVHPSNSF